MQPHLKEPVCTEMLLASCRKGIKIRDPPQANPMAVIKDLSEDFLAACDLPDGAAAEIRRVAPTAPSSYIYTFQGFA